MKYGVAHVLFPCGTLPNILMLLSFQRETETEDDK